MPSQHDSTSEQQRPGQGSIPRSRRSWLRFGLRSLIAAVTLAAMLFGAYRGFALPYVRQAEIRDAILAAGGQCETRPAPYMLNTFLGDRACVVTGVNLDRYGEGSARSYGLGRSFHDRVVALLLRDQASVVAPDERLLTEIADLEDLEALILSGQDVTDETLASWRRLKRLTTLDVSNTLVRDPDRWPQFPLQSLDVSSNLLRDDEIAKLVRYRQLRVLKMARTPVTDDGFAQLVPLQKLEELEISYAGITPDSLATLQSFPKLDLLDACVSNDALRNVRIEVVNAARGSTANDGINLAPEPALAAADFSYVSTGFECGVGMLGRTNTEAWLHAAGGLHLDQLANLPQTTRLLPVDSLVRGQDLHYLSALPELYEINLDGVVLRDNDLAQLQQCSQLTELRLGNTPITDAGIEALDTFLSRLQWLNLENAPVTDESLSSIASCTSLKGLSLEGTLITDDGLQYLAGMTNLEMLTLPVEGIRGPGLHHLLELPRLPRIHFEKDAHEYWRLHPHTPPAPLTADEVRWFIPLANAMADSPNPEPRAALYSRYHHGSNDAFMPQVAHEALLIYLLAEFELTPEALRLLPDGGRAHCQLRADSP